MTNGHAPGRTPGAYHHGDLRASLMDAVEQLLVEGGPGGVSLRRAARIAGVSHAAPAHHFGDLHGLLAAVAERGHTRFAAALAEARDASPSADLGARLRATGLAYVRFAAGNQGVFSVMFRGDLDPGAVAGTDSFAVLTDLIRVGTGDLPEDHPDVLRLALFVWAAVHGVAELWIQQVQLQEGGALTLDDMFDLVAGSVLAGLRADPAWVAGSGA